MPADGGLLGSGRHRDLERRAWLGISRAWSDGDGLDRQRRITAMGAPSVLISVRYGCRPPPPARRTAENSGTDPRHRRRYRTPRSPAFTNRPSASWRRDGRNRRGPGAAAHDAARRSPGFVPTTRTGLVPGSRRMLRFTAALQQFDQQNHPGAARFPAAAGLPAAINGAQREWAHCRAPARRIATASQIDGRARLRSEGVGNRRAR